MNEGQHITKLIPKINSYKAVVCMALQEEPGAEKEPQKLFFFLVERFLLRQMKERQFLSILQVDRHGVKWEHQFYYVSVRVSASSSTTTASSTTSSSSTTSGYSQNLFFSFKVNILLFPLRRNNDLQSEKQRQKLRHLCIISRFHGIVPAMGFPRECV